MLDDNEGKTSAFNQQLQASRQRLVELQQCTNGATAPSARCQVEAIAELSLTLEELSVTAEELSQQNEVLIATRQELEAERERYQSLFEFAPDGYFVTDPQGITLETNQAGAQLLNVPQPYLQGKPLAIFVADADRQHFRSKRQQLATQRRPDWQQPGDWLLDVQPRKQPHVPALISVSASFNFQGQVTGLRWLLRDLSERQRAEQTIHDQAALLDIASDAILVENGEHQIAYWNQGAERLYGWTADEALSQNTQELLYGESLSELEIIQRVVAEQGEWQGELVQHSRSGQSIIVDSRWTQVQTQDATLPSTLIVNTDITEKKQLQAQIQQAQRLESIGTLASGIAHDLNNILTPVLAIAQLLPLKLPEVDPSIQRMLEIMTINVQRGANLIQQVLIFARGTTQPPTVFSLHNLFSEVEKIVTATFPKSITYCSDIPPDLWAVHGDATALHQVLMNLCINARDAMPNGGTLCVAAENVAMDETYARMYVDAHAGLYVVITCSDTGTGIPPDQLVQIFDPFFTTKAQSEGIGLGLATVRGIIKSYDGFIQVSSRVGEGSQFQVFLPAADASMATPVEPQEVVSGNGELILVVDDEAPIREITQASLPMFNYRVLTASDGIQALALYAQQQDDISVVLMDLMMPQMDGAVTIQALQAMNPQVKIIASSGLISQSQVPGRLDFKVQGYLSKPYTSEQLLEILHNVIYSGSE